ncbi:MAG TPA: cohesin domain-containing protein [Candidatus Saccharimonadales bacterium]|nr:cohesin domain-containing protein [Candidatus Saccharimonadales bacterium]
MGYPAGRRRPALFVSLLLAALPGAGCQHTGADGQGSRFEIRYTEGSVSATSDVVFLRFRESGGPVLVLDVVGRDIAAPLDGMNLSIGFDPDVLEAADVSDATFLGTCGAVRPDNTFLLCADSIGSGAANSTGTLLFSAVPQGASPQPETVSGEVVLVSVTFRAHAAGVSPIYFHVTGDPGAGGTISSVTSVSDPSGAAAVAFEPGSSSPAQAEVTRP